MPVSNNNEQHLRKWLLSCPELSNRNRFHVDYLSEKPTEYSIFAQPSTIAYTENVLGEMVPRSIQKQNFLFATRDTYGADERQNLANYEFYQNIIAWMIEQNINRNLPNWEGGTVTAVVPTLTQYVSAPGTDSAKYQIQIQVTYKTH